jgi:hypothetical protein
MKTHNRFALLLLFAAAGAPAAFAAPTPLIPPEVLQSATPAQKLTLADCTRAAMAKCPLPVCDAGTPDVVDACIRPYAQCAGSAKYQCAAPLLSSSAAKK